MTEETKQKVTEILNIATKVILDRFPEYTDKDDELKACLNGFIYGAQWIQEQIYLKSDAKD
jgi:hypothetical protein